MQALMQRGKIFARSLARSGVLLGGDAIPAVKSQCCKRGQASDPDSCASLESSLRRRGDDAMLSSANKLRLQTNWDANCDTAIQTGMQTAPMRYKLGCKLRYCDTNWDGNCATAIQTGMQTAPLRYKLGCKLRYCDTNWDANRETAMPCNVTAYYCHHDWDSTAI